MKVAECRTNPILREFIKGKPERKPDENTVESAAAIIAAAERETELPEFEVHSDGALSIDLRTRNGMLMLAELRSNGDLDFGLYRFVSQQKPGREVEYYPHATAADLIAKL